MKLHKLIPETIITRILDGFLAWCVCLLFQFMLIKNTNNITMTAFFQNADMNTLKLFLIGSSIIGIVKIGCEATGIIKRTHPDACGLMWAIIMTGYVLLGVIKGILLATFLLFSVDWMEHHFFLNKDFCHMLEIGIVLWSAIRVQVKTVPDCLPKYICEILGSFIFSVSALITSLFEGITNLLGKRMMLAIIEIFFCLVCSFLLLGAGDKIGLIENYSEETTFLLSEWYDENGEDLMLDKLHLDKYFKGSLGQTEISKDTYNFLKVFPIGCAFAGLVLMLCGLGLLGNLAVITLGWNENALMEYDSTHKKRWVRTDYGHGKVHYSYTNGNPHGVIWLLLIIILFSLSFITGLFMPLFILGNLVLGIISLFFRGITGTA